MDHRDPQEAGFGGGDDKGGGRGGFTFGFGSRPTFTFGDPRGGTGDDDNNGRIIGLPTPTRPVSNPFRPPDDDPPITRTSRPVVIRPVIPPTHSNTPNGETSTRGSSSTQPATTTVTISTSSASAGPSSPYTGTPWPDSQHLSYSVYYPPGGSTATTTVLAGTTAPTANNSGPARLSKTAVALISTVSVLLVIALALCAYRWRVIRKRRTRHQELVAGTRNWGVWDTRTRSSGWDFDSSTQIQTRTRDSWASLPARPGPISETATSTSFADDAAEITTLHLYTDASSFVSRAHTPGADSMWSIPATPATGQTVLVPPLPELPAAYHTSRNFSPRPSPIETQQLMAEFRFPTRPSP